MTEQTLKPFTDTRTTLPFVLGLVLGCGAWFRVFGVALLGSAAEVQHELVVWWYTGAGVVSGIIGTFQPRLPVFWSMGFAVPIIAWCVLCTLQALGDPAYFWWTRAGGFTVAAAWTGAFLGRLIGKSVA